MHDVFLSHASDDKERVRPLVEALTREHLDVWWDGDLKAGDRFVELIEKELQAARCVVVCWSRSALRPGGDWVRGEAENARGRGVAISVLLDEIDLPTPFNVLQSVKLVGWDGDRSAEGFRQLVKGVRARLEQGGRPQAHSPGKRALLVGVGGYLPGSGFATLPAARRNVDQLERTLKQPACGFEVTTLRDPDKQELEIALESFFGAAGPGGFILFYYTGHLRLSSVKSFQVTARNSTPETLKSTTISLSSLGQEYVNTSPARQVLLVFDACYGDANPDDVAGALQTHLGPGRDKVVIAAGAGAGPEAWNEPHSLLTARLIRALETDEADNNKDQVVTAEEIIHFLDEQIGSVRGAPQPLHWPFNAAPGQMELLRRGGGLRYDVPLTEEQSSFVATLAPELEQGTIIPFLGDGIYGAGPLSFFRITGALSAKAGLGTDKHDNVGIATAAESLELQREDRGVFLRELRKILAEQAAVCEPPAVHDLIVDMKPPWLVVSVNYDDLLERRLAKAGRPYVLVCHILRSGSDEDAPRKNEHAGRILVVRSKDHPEVKRDPNRAVEICTSELLLRPEDCIVYKLLGSPFLHDLPLAEEHQLDTVVITETDHIDFLTKLRDPSTGVPRAFITRLFRMRKLLFLQYNLDIWHYRLIGHVFRKSDAAGRMDGSVVLTKTPYVVRTAISTTEERFWRRFKPDRIEMDLTTLVRALRAARSQRQ